MRDFKIVADVFIESRRNSIMAGTSAISLPAIIQLKEEKRESGAWTSWRLTN